MLRQQSSKERTLRVTAAPISSSIMSTSELWNRHEIQVRIRLVVPSESNAFWRSIKNGRRVLSVVENCLNDRGIFLKFIICVPFCFSISFFVCTYFRSGTAFARARVWVLLCAYFYNSTRLQAYSGISHHSVGPVFLSRLPRKHKAFPFGRQCQAPL